MDISSIKSQISKLNLNGFKLVQTKDNSLLLLKSKLKYSDCIYINLNDNNIEIIHDKVFDNKTFYKGIERLLLSKIEVENQVELFRYLISILR